MGRFRVFNIEKQSMPFTSDSLKDVIGFLKPYWKSPDRSLYDFAIDCTVDDLEENWEELMTAVDRGEEHIDLSNLN